MWVFTGQGLRGGGGLLGTWNGRGWRGVWDASGGGFYALLCFGRGAAVGVVWVSVGREGETALWRGGEGRGGKAEEEEEVVVVAVVVVVVVVKARPRNGRIRSKKTHRMDTFINYHLSLTTRCPLNILHLPFDWNNGHTVRRVDGIPHAKIP